MKIFAFHLLNDYSGSPKVLMQLVKGWVAHDNSVHIVTCAGRQGFLSDIAGAHYHFFAYRWAKSTFLRLFLFFGSQFWLFWKTLFLVGRQDVVYINTVLPFGAALAGKLKGCKVIYHIHETSLKPAIFKRFLFAWVRFCATEVVYVSQYLAQQEPISQRKKYILYNAIEDDFLQKAIENRRTPDTPQNVLMVCSLKVYKGVWQFVHLAEANPQFRFRLIVNASKEELTTFWETYNLPANLETSPTQTNLHPHYAWADAILNLSLPDAWVETFGLTIIEGMAYGLPAIVPPIGGIAELIEEGKNGFQCDSRDLPTLSAQLNRLLQDVPLYKNMAENARQKIASFSEKNFIRQSLAILKNK
jgi:glycosyltransferase involved in cell wall biosynthesis